MRLHVFYALVTRNNAISLHPVTAYHTFECAVDTLRPLDTGIQVGIEIARRVDLISFRIANAACSRELLRYQINQVQHGIRTSYAGPCDFDEALQTLQELFISRNQLWTAMQYYEMQPERPGLWFEEEGKQADGI